MKNKTFSSVSRSKELTKYKVFSKSRSLVL